MIEALCHAADNARAVNSTQRRGFAKADPQNILHLAEQGPASLWPTL